MTTPKPKRAICYGLYPVWGLPMMVDEGHYLESTSYCAMKVTSFTRLRSGTVMAHGAELPTGGSHHRKVDGMFFYETKEAMQLAMKRLSKIEPKLNKEVREAIEHSANVQRGRRILLEKELGQNAIQPLALEDL